MEPALYRLALARVPVACRQENPVVTLTLDSDSNDLVIAISRPRFGIPDGDRHQVHPFSCWGSFEPDFRYIRFGGQIFFKQRQGVLR